jgi:transposase-like protein
MKNFKNLMDLTDFFNTEKKCYEFLKANLYKDGIVCSECGSKNIFEFKTNYKRCRCLDCKFDFSLRKGTIFEESRLPLRKWFVCIYLVTSNSKGLSSVQLAKQVGITQKTAWFVLQRLRAVAENGFGAMFQGTCEADTTHIGGKYENMHKAKKETKPEKAVVLGIVNRETKQVKSFHIENESYVAQGEKILDNVDFGSELITDESKSYVMLKHYFKHNFINHSKGEYSRNDLSRVAFKITTNSVEGVFSQLKRGINGIYHWCSKKHLQKYLNEFNFRYNSRELADNQRFISFLENVQGRLTYKELIGRV